MEGLTGAYKEVEAYRESKGDRITYGGRTEDKVIKDWVDLIWNEGWNHKAGFAEDFPNLRKTLTAANAGKKDQALKELNRFTDLIYADGSVGNVRDGLWTLSKPVTRLLYKGHQIQITFQNAKKEEYSLLLGLFEGGIIHVVGKVPGYFEGKDLVPAKVTFQESNGVLEARCESEKTSIFIQKQPFGIKVLKDGVEKFFQTGFNVAGPPSAPRGVRLSFQAAPPDEYLGFGERFDTLKHKHSIFAQWSMGMAEALKNGSSESYKPIPFYLNPVNSTGMFYNHGGIVRWDVEGSESGVVDVSSVGGTCDYFLFVGSNPYDIYRAYTLVTGRIFAVADWVHMPWMGHHFGGVPTKNDRLKRLVDELVNFNKYGYTYSAMYAAGISSSGPEITEIYQKYMQPLGVKLGIHLDPMNKPNAGGKSNIPLVKRADGSVFISDHAFQAGNGYIDFSVPGTSEQAFTPGISQIAMLDFGEQVGWDGVLSKYPDYSGREIHNLYQHLYHQAASLNFSAKFPNGDWMSFARSAWAGDQAVGGYFAGDTSCSMANLKSTIRAGINLCASAGVYWGADIGAYIRQPPLTKERYLRWIQFGCFSPLMRTHAHEDKEMRPWKFDDEMLASFKYYTWLRASLVPYIRACGQLASSDGIPILRALPIEFPTDAKAFLDDEYMFGPSLLVAPLVTEEMSARSVYLPEGTWFNLFTHEKSTGNATIEVAAKGWEQMPVYVKAPVILPIRIGRNSPQPGHSYFKSAGTDLYSDPAIDAFQIFPVNDAALTVYPDAAVSYENKNGAVVLKIKADNLRAKPVHFEIVDVRNVSQVIAGNLTLQPSSSWQAMMAKPNQYFHDQSSRTLYVNATGS